jgi:hypothetical protein
MFSSSLHVVNYDVRREREMIQKARTGFSPCGCATRDHKDGEIPDSADFAIN